MKVTYDALLIPKANKFDESPCMNITKVSLTMLVITSLASCTKHKDKFNTHVFINTCEKLLKASLKAPSTLKIIGTDNLSSQYSASEKEIIDLQQELKQLNLQKNLSRLDETGKRRLKETISAYQNGTARAFKADIRYEAKNAFNVPLQDNFTCEYHAANGSYDLDGWEIEYHVKINGKTIFERGFERD